MAKQIQRHRMGTAVYLGGVDPGQLDAAAADAVAASPAIAELTPGEGEVITATSSGPAAWNNGVFDASHPRWGIVGDGVADDTAALQAMADACEAASGRLVIPQHMDCRITAEVSFRYIYDVDMRGKIKVSHTSGVGVVVGGSSQIAGRAGKVVLSDVTYAGTQSNVAVRVLGAKNWAITVGVCPYLQLYADADLTSDSVAYSKFRGGKVDKVEMYGTTTGAWINGNHFRDMRITHLIVGKGSTDYPHNTNIFEDCNFEAGTITFHCGSSNQITARLEGGAAITFASGTHSNRIVSTYSVTESFVSPPGTITDNGYMNEVVSIKERDGAYVPIWRIDAGSRTTSASSAWAVPDATQRVRPGFRKVKMPPAAAQVFDTGIFPVESATPGPNAEGGARLPFLYFISDVAAWRVRVQVYDSTMTLLDGTSTTYLTASGGMVWTPAASGYQHGTNVGTNAANTRMAFTNSTVKYARVILLAMTANAAFRYAELRAYVPAGAAGESLIDQIRRQAERPLYQTGTTPPTQSLLYPGDSIGTDTGRHVLTHRVDTTLTAAAASGATSITVASITGINAGDTIAVLLADDTTHFTTVSGAPAGSTVTLTAALTGAANSGANVATQRWLHIT